MKKFIVFTLPFLSLISLNAAEPENWSGIDVLPNFYNHKVSNDGIQMIGESENGGTVYYNRNTGEAYFYDSCDFGRGYVVSDNGWVVGSQMMDAENQTNAAVIMYKGEVIVPAPFKNFVTSNIHSITPDGSRVCGVLNPGPKNMPYYCDIDAAGNFGEVIYLPTPAKDFFGSTPQYCTATWISDDGKTIAGQVIDGRGLFAYPILYKQDLQGEWSFSYPSQALFNPKGLEVPSPLGDFDEEFPDAIYPEVEKYISPDKMQAWEEAVDKWSANDFADSLDPYNHLEDYMTEEKYLEYFEAEVYYNACQDEYNAMNELYWERMIQLADESVLFVRNAMALSPDGKWLASSGEVLRTDIVAGMNFDYYYDPYLFNLETGEIKNIGIENFDLVTNQVTDDGSVICATPVANVLPPSSYIYKVSSNEMISIYDYVNALNSIDGWWFETYLTGDIQTSETGYTMATITGLVSANKDLTTIFGGVLYSALGNNMMMISYIMGGLPAGVKEIESAPLEENSYDVYNLQGVKVMTAKDKSSLQTLPSGIYVVNGKKVMLR